MLTIQEIKQYSAHGDDESYWIDPKEYKIFFRDPPYQEEIHDVEKLLQIGDLFLAKRMNEEEWWMGDLQKHGIVCWASYGDLKSSLQSL